MAVMIPEDPPTHGGGAKAERELFLALERQLSNEFFVYHNLPYHMIDDRDRRGQVDFLILHRKHGLLFVECKGSGVCRKRNGTWIRQYEDGVEEVLKESPDSQCARHMRDFVDHLEREWSRYVPLLDRFPMLYGFAIAFPRARPTEVGHPPDLARKLVLYSDDLSNLEERILEIYGHYAAKYGERLPLKKDQFKLFRKHVLNPVFNVVPTVGARIDSEQRRFVRLSEDQINVALAWLNNPKIRIYGGAGTGKTVLAREAAVRFAARGERVLLTCFNIFLGNSLRDRMRGVGLEGGTVTAGHFHGLCEKAYELLGLPFEIPSDYAAQTPFFNEEAPAVLQRAIREGLIGPFDAIVVDEGQDFETAWWDILLSALEDGECGRFLVFFDPSQDIFGRDTAYPEGTRIDLQHNYRNTREIANAINQLGLPKVEPYYRCPNGTPPEVKQQKSPTWVQRELDELVEELTSNQHVQPGQITILTHRTRRNSSLAGRDAIAGFPLADNPEDREGRVLHTTVGKFKGLESEVVILVDVDPEDERCDKLTRYVAASRARHQLYVFARGNWAE